eukprot:17682-Heterococcus_DN1.PRE.2
MQCFNTAVADMTSFSSTTMKLCSDHVIPLMHSTVDPEDSLTAPQSTLHIGGSYQQFILTCRHNGSF